MKTTLLALCGVLSLASACQSGAPLDEGDDFSQLASQEGKADSFSYRIKLLGSLSYGQDSVSADYTSTPRFRGYSFDAVLGDKVMVNISSDIHGSVPVIWIVTDKWKVVARSVDDPTLSNFAFVGPVELVKTGSYYVVFRERTLQPARFSVSFSSPNRSQPLITAGCPGGWTRGATAGQLGEDLDFATIAGAYKRTAVAELSGAPFTQGWPLPGALTLGSDGKYQAQMELNGATTEEQGSYIAANNFMIGPVVMLQPASAPATDDHDMLRVLGFEQAPGGAISRICAAQMQGPTGRAFTLERTP